MIFLPSSLISQPSIDWMRIHSLNNNVCISLKNSSMIITSTKVYQNNIRNRNFFNRLKKDDRFLLK